MESLPDKRANLTLYPPQSPISKKSFGEKYVRLPEVESGRPLHESHEDPIHRVHKKTVVYGRTRVPNVLFQSSSVHQKRPFYGQMPQFRPRIHRNASFHGYNRQTVRSVYQIVRFYGYNSVHFILPCLFLDSEAMEIVLPVLTGRAAEFF